MAGGDGRGSDLGGEGCWMQGTAALVQGVRTAGRSSQEGC